jgi:hypothetical protein
MPGTTGNPNPSFKILSGALNTENWPQLGAPLGSPSGMIVEPYGGFLGLKWNLSADDALKESNVAIGTLYGGTYMMVKTNAAAANLTRGRLVFWDLTVPEDNYQVHQDETQNGGLPLIAGVLLCTVTAGNYCWIQVAGKATVQCRATVTAATRYITWAAAGAGVDNAAADGANTATAVTTLAPVLTFMNGFLGMGEAVAANAGLVIVDLKPLLTVRQ